MKYIEHIIEPERLLLSWQLPRGNKDRMRRFVAELLWTGNDANLIYLSDSEDFKKAKELGFECYPGYSTETQKHENVFISFLKRIPPRSRKDFDRFLNSLRIRPEMKDRVSDFALLGYSRASLPSDEFTIIHPFCNAIPPFELLTPVQGYQYHLENFPYVKAIEAEGLEITFKPEPENVKDPRAICMQVEDKRIGYVCRGLIESLHGWLEKDYSLKATIERVNGTEDSPRLYVFVSVS